MVLLVDTPSVMEVVYLVSQHGEVNVCPADGIEEHVWIIRAPRLDPIILEEEPLLSPENSDTYPQVARPLRIVTRTGFHFGVPIRFLGPGTGGMSGM